MPLTRIEIPAKSREEAHRVLDLYRLGQRAPDLEDQGRDEVWHRGRTPSGRTTLVGTMNGNPPVLLLDIDIDIDVYVETCP